MSDGLRRRARAGQASRPTAPIPELQAVVPANRPARGTPGYITLSSAFLDPRLAPTRAIERAVRRALRSPGLSTYAHAQGYPPLRALIAERLRARGIPAHADDVLVTVGSQQALDIVARALAKKHVATEDPAYIAAKALFAISGVRTTALPVDPFAGIDVARWEQRLTRARPALAYLTTHFQNPTGYSYSSTERERILAWSAELGFGILEDDWGSDMLAPGAPGPSLRQLGGDGVLYMNAFTKKTLPSLRVGYVVGNARTMPSLLQAKKLAINGLPALVEESLTELITSGDYDAYLARAQRELASRYRHTLKLLGALLPEGVRWTAPGGGPVLWLELPRHVDVHALIAALEKKKVLVNPQDAAFFGRPHLHGFMLGYAFPSRDEMTRAIEILAALLAKVRQ